MTPNQSWPSAVSEDGRSDVSEPANVRVVVFSRLSLILNILRQNVREILSGTSARVRKGTARSISKQETPTEKSGYETMTL